MKKKIEHHMEKLLLFFIEGKPKNENRINFKITKRNNFATDAKCEEI